MNEDRAEQKPLFVRREMLPPGIPAWKFFLPALVRVFVFIIERSAAAAAFHDALVRQAEDGRAATFGAVLEKQFLAFFWFAHSIYILSVSSVSLTVTTKAFVKVSFLASQLSASQPARPYTRTAHMRTPFALLSNWLHVVREANGWHHPPRRFFR